MTGAIRGTSSEKLFKSFAWKHQNQDAGWDNYAGFKNQRKITCLCFSTNSRKQHPLYYKKYSKGQIPFFKSKTNFFKKSFLPEL